MKIFKQSSLLLTLAAILTLAACGGSGGSTATSDNSSAIVISGTAAGGGAIFGSVKIKDSLGATKIVATDVAGHYSVDISGMTPPYLLHAYGVMAGRGINYLSAATSDNHNGVVNITPFTDIMVANLAGGHALTYFNASSPSAVNFTTAKLAAAQTALRTKFAQLFTSMGVSTSIDLLNSTFQADHSGIDAVMDVVRFDNANDTTVVYNSLNNTILTSDSSGVATDDAQATAILSADLVAFFNAKSDLVTIKSQLVTLQSRFVGTLPTESTLIAGGADATNFVMNGENLAGWIARFSASMIGMTFENIDLRFASASKVYARFLMVTSNGQVFPTLLIFDKSSGVWKNVGNQMKAQITLHTRSTMRLTGILDKTKAASSVFSRGLSANVNLFGTSAVDHAIVTGPGLAVGGVKLIRLSNMNFLQVENPLLPGTALSFDPMIPECGVQTTQCVSFNNSTDNAEYTFVLKDVSGISLNGMGYKLVLPKLPAASADLSAAQFPAASSFTIDSVAYSNYTQILSGKVIATSFSLPPTLSAYNVLFTASAAGGAAYASQRLAPATRIAWLTHNNIPLNVTEASFNLTAIDAEAREYSTLMY